MSIIGQWKKLVMGHTLCFGGGGSSGGGGGTSQSSQYTNLTPWAQPYVTSILGAGQKQVFNTNEAGDITGIRPYNAYGSFNEQGGQYGINPSAQAAANAAVAGFQPLQQQAYQGAADLSQSQAPSITGGAALGSLYAGQNLANQSTNPAAVGAYMNPYIQNALNPALQLLNQQYGIAGAQQQGQATQAGAFGGSREALMNSLNRQNQMLAQNQLVGNAYNQAYGNAQNQMNQVAQLGLQGYGQAGSLAGQQLAQQQGILGLQNQFGGQQQQQQQNIINAGMANYQQAQQYPMQQLGQLKGLLSGIPVTDVTTTQEQAQPSAVSQLAGLGTAGVAGLALANKAAEGGLMKSYAAGGTVKGYAPGGIAALNRKALLNPNSIPQKSLNDGILNPQVSGIAKAIQLSERVRSQADEAAKKGAPQGTVLSDLEAKAEKIDEAEMLPKAIAVLKHKLERALAEGDIPLAQKYEAELQQLVQMAQGQQEQQTPSAPAPAGIEQLASNAGQVPEQGIEAAPTNLPTQTMADGGIVGYASRGLVDEDERYASKEEADDAEMAELYGTGSENDFIQAIKPAAQQSGTAHPSAGIAFKFEPREGKTEFTATKKGSHKYENEVISAAKEIGLPEQIAIHAAYKETGNLKNPESARSKAGAIGVMQLMPATAKELGVDPYNPQENIRGGVAYLKKLYDKYQDPQLTLMAYNAGPGRVDRALRSEKGIASLPQETLNYRLAAGGAIKGYSGEDDESLVSADPAEVRRAYIEAAEIEAGLRSPYRPSQADVREAEKRILYNDNRPNRVSQADVREAEDRIAYNDNRPNRVSQATLREAEDRIAYNDNRPNRVSQATLREAEDRIARANMANLASQADVRASDNRIAQMNAAAPAIIDTSERDRERARAIATANTNQRSMAPAAPASPVIAGQTPIEQGISAIAPVTKRSAMDDIQEEILQDIRARRAAAKESRDTNNLLALMQAGFTTAASKNIHPLGAIGEGGAQGVGTLAALRKQEGEEAKDIAAQQLGLYKYKTAAEAKAAETAALEKYRMATLGAKPDKEDLEMQKIEKALSMHPQIRDLRERMALEAKNGTLTAELEAKYQSAINKVIQSVYKGFGRAYTPVDIGTITPLPPPEKPSLWDKITGKNQNTGTPPLPPGFQEVK